MRYYALIKSMSASYFLSVAPPPFRPPLLSGLLVSFPRVPVGLFFFLFTFFLFLLFFFVIIHLHRLFVFLFNSNPFIIYFSIFQFTILSKKRKTSSTVNELYGGYMLYLCLRLV